MCVCVCLLPCKDSFFPYLSLTIMKTGPRNLLSSFLLLRAPDIFLINGRRMDGLTEGLDNNGWSTGHKCSYWGDLWAFTHLRLQPMRWFLKAPRGRQLAQGKAPSLVPVRHLLIRQFWVEATSRCAPRKEHAGRKHDNNCRIRVWNCQGKSGALENRERPSINDVFYWRKLRWFSCKMQELLWGNQPS